MGLLTILENPTAGPHYFEPLDPKPPNYPLIYPKYQLLRAIRTLLKGPCGVLLDPKPLFISALVRPGLHGPRPKQPRWQPELRAEMQPPWWRTARGP